MFIRYGANDGMMMLKPTQAKNMLKKKVGSHPRLGAALVPLPFSAAS